MFHKIPDTDRYTLADTAPEWLREAVLTAHHNGQDPPNDWIYETCADAYQAIVAGDLDASDEDGDSVHMWADSYVEIYTRPLFQWAADMCHSTTWATAEDEYTDGGGEASDMVKRLMAIQYYAIRFIAETMCTAYRENVK